MSDSHSTTLVQLTTEAVQQYLAAQRKVELPTMRMAPDVRGIGLAHAVNRLLRPARLHVCRSRVMDELVRKARRGYSPINKGVALGTIIQIAADPSGFDAVYEELSDEESRRTFDWFISYRAALAFLGEDADDVVPCRMSPAVWRETLDQASRSFADGAYHVGGVSVDSGLAEVAATFFLEQYRLKGIVEPGAGDIVVDCGAYRGETVLWFARQVGECGRIVAIEPSSRNAEGLRANLAANRIVSMAPVIVLQCAVAASAGMLSFNGQAEECSCEDADSAESVLTTTIDDIVEQQHLGRVDFIKMDIEGGEVNALRGAERTLEEFTPRLAISVYHRPRDLTDIVTLIRQACPDYRLHLSHKSPGLAETVLFACRA